MDEDFRRPVLSEAVREYIINYILAKRLQPGALLPPETQLAHDLGVGRSSIREAVKALQSLGIIDVRRGEGFFVREWNFDPVLETLSYGIRFNRDAFAELLQIRVWLESATVGEVIEQISPREIAELEHVIAQWETRAAGGGTFADLDERFHDVLYATLRNETFVKLLNVFWRAFETVNTALAGEANIRTELEAHRAILHAIQAGDVALTRTRLVASFDNLRARLQATSQKNRGANKGAAGS